MDIVSLGFLFVIVLLGGVSAFMADWLAWRIGKRRLTVMNMRPKHFARLVVTIAGALIPLVTILVLAGASEGVRTWITQGREAAVKLPSVVKELEAAETNLGDAKKQADELRRQSEERRRVFDNQKLKLDEQSRKIAEQVRKIGELAPKIVRLAKREKLSAQTVKRLTNRNTSVQKALVETQKAFKKGREDLQGLKGELQIVKLGTDAAKTETTAAISKRDTAIQTYTDTNARNQKLTFDNNKLEKSVEDLTAKISELTSEIAELSTSRDKARTETEAARDALNELKSQVVAIQDDRDRLELALRLFADDFAQSRLQPLSFRVGDEIARFVVPSGLALPEARVHVQALLRLARIEAERRGARPSQISTGLPTAAGLLPQPLKDKTKFISPEEQVELLATNLAGSKADSVLVATASFNYFGSEAVALTIAAYPSPLVFESGAVVAEGRLDSRRGDAGIYAQITEFLGSRVKERARELKMIPVRTAGEDNFGEVEPGEVLRAIRIAGNEQRVYRLQAIAVGEIRAGDRLKIELRLK